MDLHTAKQAILTFDGDVYDGLRANEMSKAELNFAQSQLRMLSGLYGLLRPLDLMLPYRLEMGTRLANLRGKDLYAFWGTQITDNIGQAIKESNSQCLLNLASEEYFKAVKPKLLDVPVITPVFEDFKNGQFKVISFFAKRARGSMARFAICHKVRKVAQLKDFAEDGYALMPRHRLNTNGCFVAAIWKRVGTGNDKSTVILMHPTWRVHWKTTHL